MSFGSASPMLGQGASDALQQAMQRRQTGQAGVTAQQTPASAGFNPQTQIPQPPTGGVPGMSSGGAPSMNPIGQSPQLSQPPQNPLPQSGGLPPGDPDATVIIKTLAKRLTG